MARANGGIYIKAAQFVASMQGGGGDKVVPRAFVDTLRVLTDHAPSRGFDAVDVVLREDLGSSGAQLFASIEAVPIAAASLAQVHVAVTKDGKKCALKVQYPELRANMASDLAVFRTMGSQVRVWRGEGRVSNAREMLCLMHIHHSIHSAQMRPGGMDLTWLVDDFETFLTAEVDFRGEADNTEAAAAATAHLPDVLVRHSPPTTSFPRLSHSPPLTLACHQVPRVLRHLSGPRVLTTTFVDGLIRVDDLPRLRQAGMHPWAVGAALSRVFSDMALCGGTVHGDPHAGNVYVRPMTAASTAASATAATAAATPVRRLLAKAVSPGRERAVRARVAAAMRAAAGKSRDRAPGWALAFEEAASRVGGGSATDGVDDVTALRVQPQVVLLDHGLYHALDARLRTALCRLVLASVAADSGSMQLHSGTLAGVPHDVASPMRRFFPLVLSHWFVFSLGLWAVTPGDMAAARQGTMPPGLTLQDLGDFLTGLHGSGGNVLGVLHSQGYTRGLLNGLAFPERRRLRALAQAAARGCGSSQLVAGLRVDALAWVILPALSILAPLYHLLLRPLWLNTDLAALLVLLLALAHAAWLH